ncbi:Hypothetical protein I595_767 [Croceitalea dokdonensis DOKDO 023]|uniref:Secretion system C-terminal sorting domain-containing protein n=1 Tax=Croceitalea dokdonensis DOKDO 023 TaxID=1300341 RepID=A0A0N8H4N4_9FLAO|nr:Hypothetical protein I595_767 [Croceitalea dokdonensis DOKDO 023]
MEIFDSAGRRLELLELRPNDSQLYEMDLSSYTTGVYYVMITDVSGNRIQRQLLVAR